MRLARLFPLVPALLLVVALGASASAQRFALPPAPTDLPIQDTAGLLSASERQALGQKLVAFDDSTGAQLAVAIVPTVDGADLNEYATALGRSWGVGNAEEDNGVVLLVALNDRQLYIATGYGAEGPLPDALAAQIIREVITPRFRQSQFYAGLDEGTDAILAALRGEYEPSAQPRPTASGEGLDAALCLVFVIFIVFFALAMANRGRPGPPSSGGRRRRGRSGPGVIFIPTSGGSWGGSGG
ncbi:MAG TPA: TPM domain-containing protein, partial [Rhodothermales bacterium]|nr:TPM domain-containing protein [Rhodothermales bacterium]